MGNTVKVPVEVVVTYLICSQYYNLVFDETNSSQVQGKLEDDLVLVCRRVLSSYVHALHVIEMSSNDL